MLLLSVPQLIFVGIQGELPGWEENNAAFATQVLGRGLATLAVGIPVMLLVLRFLWRRPSGWLRIDARPRQLLPGILLGVLAPLPPLAILMLAGLAEIERAPLLAAPLVALQLLVAYLPFWLYAAAVEEIVFRGMVIREAAARHGWIPAWLLGGAFFGLIHFEPGYGWLGAAWLLVGGILVSGLFLALYRRGRSLWLPIGFHLGWNFCLTNLIGAPMSGKVASAGLLRTAIEGPAFLTGGDFGMEISTVTLLFYALYAFVGLRLPLRDGGELLSHRASGAD